jgi:hypothetical protein
VQQHARGSGGERRGASGGGGAGGDELHDDAVAQGDGEGDGNDLGIDGDELARAFELQLRYDEGRT